MTTISIKKSAVPGKVPLVTDLSYGELALNYADGILYYKSSANQIQSISGGVSVTSLIAGTDTAISNSTGAVTIWNTGTLQSVTGRGSSTTNSLSILNNTNSTSTNSGALIVSGGVGVGGGIYAGGTVTATQFVGNLTGTATTAQQVQTQAQTANASYYPAFVSANNASPTAMSVYTTNSLIINPGTGNLGLGVTPTPGQNFAPVFQIGRTILNNGVNDRMMLAYNYARVAGVDQYIANDYATYYTQISGQHRWYSAPSGTAGNTITFTQAMMLFNSGGLSIGNTTDPGATNLSVTGTIASASTVTGTALIPSGSTAPTNGMFLPTTNAVAWATNSTERMRLDANGILGIGVTPSAWSGYGAPVVEIGLGGTFVANGSVNFGSNFYYTGGNLVYKINSGASYYQQNAGTHKWFIAPSGTAGNPITFTTAMALFNSGGLSLGNTTDPGATNLSVSGTVTSTYIVATGATGGLRNQGAISYGTLSYSDNNNLLTLQANTNTYAQLVIQNTSTGATASSDITISNDQGTAANYYANFGINSSGFSGSGAFSAPNATYVASAGGDLALGSYGNNSIRFVLNSGATDALTISTVSNSVVVNLTATITSSVAAVSTNTGALTVAGGIGVGGGVYVGGVSTFTNYVRQQILNTPAQDLVNISNVGYPATTAGLNNLSITYVGGAAAVEASAGRVDITPGTTTAGTWNAWRAVAATGAFSGVTYNGIKFDSMPSASTGTANAVFVGTGYTNVLNYNNTTVIDGTGNIIQRSTGTYFAGSTLQGLTAGINSQAQAIVANAQIIEFSTVAANSATVLPYVNTGTRIFIANDGANPLNIYPPVGGLIDQAATNAAITLSAGGMWEGVAISTSTWTSISPDTQGTTNQITVTQGIGVVVLGLSNTLTAPGTLNVPNTSTSTSTTTGALTVAGGVGVGGNIVVGGYGAGFRYMTVFTSGLNQTWAVPSGVTRFKVTIAGGGGQGGGTPATAGATGGGGGSGGVIMQYYNFVPGQTTLTLSVGAGGSGAGTNANGTNGAATTATYNAVAITAGGGTGGTANGAGGSGGTATGGTLNIPGQTGSSGGTTAPTAVRIPNGGNTPLGFGWGGMIPTSVTSSVAGGGYGGGGGGAYNGATATATAGGAGAPGVAIVEY